LYGGSERTERRRTEPVDARRARTTDGKPDLSGIWKTDPTPIDELNRLFPGFSTRAARPCGSRSACGAGTMDMSMSTTIDDPRTYTKPFTIRYTQTLIPDSAFLEYVGAENERDVAHLAGK
jgi:hypothetical protein